MRPTWLAPVVVGALAAGCQEPVVRGTVSDVSVVGLADLTGRTPADVRAGLAERVRTLAVEIGLIGDAGQSPGTPLHVRGKITEFPARGKSMAGAGGWIVAGPMTVEWTATEPDGAALGTRTITTYPTDAIEANEDPFVYTQARAVVLWLMGE